MEYPQADIKKLVSLYNKLVKKKMRRCNYGDKTNVKG